VYLHASMAMKEKALARPLPAKREMAVTDPLTAYSRFFEEPLIPR